jgi:hypothetical protein
MLLGDINRENQRHGPREPEPSRQARRPGKYEWWHFDHVVHHKKNWIDLGGEIGYSPDALSAPEVGEKPFWNGGIGYADPDIKKRIFGKLEDGAPGNGDTSTVAATTATLEAAEEGGADQEAAEETGE